MYFVVCNEFLEEDKRPRYRQEAKREKENGKKRDFWKDNNNIELHVSLDPEDFWDNGLSFEREVKPVLESMGFGVVEDDYDYGNGFIVQRFHASGFLKNMSGAEVREYIAQRLTAMDWSRLQVSDVELVDFDDQ